MSRVIKAHEVAAVDVMPLGAGDGHLSNRLEEGGRPGASGIDEARAVLEAAKRQAAALLERAERLASQRMAALAQREQEVAEAYQKALVEGRETGFQEGYAAGYREGLAAGEKEGLERVEALIASAQALLEAARQSQESAEEQAREDLIKLAVAVASKLVGRALDASSALAILEGMLAKVEGSQTAVVRLPREVYALLEERREFLHALERDPGAGCKFSFLVDDTLNVGDVVVETDWGLIDGRIRSRWRRILQGLDLLEDGADGGG